MQNLLPNTFSDDEQLLRAVYVKPPYWVNGRLSSAALKDPNGLSVERTYTRSLKAAIEYMRNHLSGNIITFTLDDCHSVSAVVRYLPSHKNIYHCEIHGSTTQVVLNSTQAFELALRAKVAFSINITPS